MSAGWRVVFGEGVGEDGVRVVGVGVGVGAGVDAGGTCGDRGGIEEEDGEGEEGGEVDKDGMHWCRMEGSVGVLCVLGYDVFDLSGVCRKVYLLPIVLGMYCDRCRKKKEMREREQYFSRSCRESSES